MSVINEWFRRCFDKDPTFWSMYAVIFGMLVVMLVSVLAVWGAIRLSALVGFWGWWLAAAMLVGVLLLLFVVGVVKTWENTEESEELSR